MVRAFTLLEAMVVVAIIGIFAAIAVPGLLPQVFGATLEGGTENVATFLARARADAMTSKRCVRVWVPSTATHTMVAERLNNFDCDVNPTLLPGTNNMTVSSTTRIGIDGTNKVWIEFARLVLDSKVLRIAVSQPPSSSTSTSLAPGSAVGTPAGFTGDEIRFRPNGRVFSNDTPTVLTNDDAVVTVTHPQLATRSTKKILVDGNGYICVMPRGVDPAVDGATPNLKCP